MYTTSFFWEKEITYDTSFSMTWQERKILQALWERESASQNSWLFENADIHRGYLSPKESGGPRKEEALIDGTLSS